MNDLSSAARSSEFSSSFADGQASLVTSEKPGAGGGATKTPYRKMTGDGSALNRSRLNGGTERNYSTGPVSLPNGSTAVPRPR